MPITCSTKRLQLLALLLAGAFIIVVLMILFAFNYPTFARERIIDAVVFKNGSDALTRFQSTKDVKNLRLAFYVFNITNPDEFRNGTAKLNLNEIGPFVYDGYKEKQFLDNDQTAGLITFKLLTRYKFNRELSIADPADIAIVWPNIPLLVTQAKVSQLSLIENIAARAFLNSEIDRFLPTEGAFMNDTAQNFLFGGSKRAFFEHLQQNAIVRYYLNPWPLKDNKFGLLYGKNFTWNPLTDHTFTASTGFGTNQTYADLNQFVKIDNSTTMKFWQPQPPQCNQMGGTDGQFFSPFMQQPSQLTLYASDLCRKLNFKFAQQSYVSGVPALKFDLDGQTLANGQKNPENQCYCLQRYGNGSTKPVCDLDGLIDLSNCDAPNILGSSAHFMHGSPELVTRLSGLTPPDEAIHQSSLYVEPNTGITIKVRVPIQLNVRFEGAGFKIFDFFNDQQPLHVPLMWLAETTELDDNQASMLKKSLLLLDSWLITMVLGATIVFLVGIPVIGFIVCCRYRRSSSEPTETDPLLPH